jgi:tripartite-type tricarboxylate transporter receptor subunit TctC
MFGRRAALITLFALAGLAVAGGASAQSYPNRPVTVIVPFAAGGSVDATARFVLPRLAERLKQPVVIENVPGAAGTIGTQRAIRASPDGYTLLFAVASPVTIAKLVTPTTVKYDALKELTPIAMVGNSPFVLVGRTGLPANSTAELLALLRAQPGKLNYGTDGVGTSMHLTAELIKQRANLKIEHVPYKQGPQILSDLMGNQIDLAVLPLTLVHETAKSGKVKAFGVTSRQRWPTAPEIPSLSEVPELKDLDFVSWYGLFAPAATDRAIVDRLVREMAGVLDEPDVVRRLSEVALVPAKMNPAQFAAHLRKEQQDLELVVKAANIKAE